MQKTTRRQIVQVCAGLSLFKISVFATLTGLLTFPCLSALPESAKIGLSHSYLISSAAA